MNMSAVAEMKGEPYDVLVAGGGMAGIAAAVAAGRGGARTLLVDKAGWLGGMGITGATGLHSFYNIFGAHEGVERMRVVAGVAQDLVDRVQQLGGGVGHVRMERGGDFISMLTPVEPETFKLAAIKLLAEAGAEMLLHSVLDEVRADGGRVEGIVVANKAGRSLIRAKQYVDCTGDGDLAAWAGADFEHFKAGDHGAYAAGFTFRMCNVDLAALEAGMEGRGMISQLAHAVKPWQTAPDVVRIGMSFNKLIESGVDFPVRGILSSSLRPRELTFCNCINYGPNDGLDPYALTAAENYLRERMFDVASAFREHLPGCENCYPAGPAPSAGQRRGRAIRCEYELTQDDCTEGRRFDDQIAVFSFIDNGRFLVRDGGAYGIPYRALQPRGLDNVLIAGRMMTVDLVGHNTTRNTVCCLICGQAAGAAAAMAAAKGVSPKAVDAQELRDKLAAGGALLDPKPEPIGEER